MKELIQSRNLVKFSQELSTADVTNQSELCDLLALSIREELPEFVRILLKKGADPNGLPEGEQWNHLHLAVEFGNRDILKMLLDAGADPNALDCYGFSPLQHAVDTEADSAHQLNKKPHPSLSKLLLEYGADPFLPDNTGVTAVDLARDYEYLEFLDLIAGRAL